MFEMPSWFWMLLAVVVTPFALAALMIAGSRSRDHRRFTAPKPPLRLIAPEERRRTGTANEMDA